MVRKKKSIWLSYDFGLKGNYSALFTFLDNKKAIECGNSMAYFIYENEKMVGSDDLIEILKQELEIAISPSNNDRIYVIWRDDEANPGSIKGRFLFGSRKTPSWNGYANNLEMGKDDIALE